MTFHCANKSRWLHILAILLLSGGSFAAAATPGGSAATHRSPHGLEEQCISIRQMPGGIYSDVRWAVERSGIKKKVTTYSLRHTCATHMLNNGAPIRHIQEMLGHESLETTQIYTRVTITDLKKVHAKYHPSEQLNA